MMLDENEKLVLGDFGVSQFFEANSEIIKGTLGTIRFMAPEHFTSEGEKMLNGKSVDVWASGVTLYMMLTNEFPFKGKTLQEITSQIKNDVPDYSLIKNNEIKRLLKSILEKDYLKRLTTIDIIEDDWLTQNGEDPINLDLISIIESSDIQSSEID